MGLRADRAEPAPDDLGTSEPGARLPLSVTAVVLNYDGRHLLEVMLPSLAGQRYPVEEVVVVDNGSRDDSVRWLRSSWPAVQVIAIPRNVGVTAALNVCLRAGTGDVVALFNNDMELDADCVGELVGALERHPQAAVAAAKLIDFYDREILDGAGDVYEWSGEANRRGQGARDLGQFDRPEAVFAACGGAAAYRRQAIRSVGEFDEQLYAIYEDVDWSFRAQLLGFTCRYVPSAVAYHMGSATIGRGLSDFALYQNWRNGIWVAAKNYPLAAMLRHGHRFLNSQAHNLVWAIQTKRLRVFLRVWRDALLGMPAIVRKRRRIQRSRRIGLRELERVIGVEP